MIINLNHPERGDLAVKFFRFPDGQNHCEIDPALVTSSVVELIVAITSADDLLNLGLLIDALSSINKEPRLQINLNISYLLGARMDRRIAQGQPATLQVIAAILQSWSSQLSHIRILDLHSSVAHQWIKPLEILVPDSLVQVALKDEQTVIVCPDAGAVPRTLAIIERLKLKNPVARCAKKRDSQTGKLSGFELVSGELMGKKALIVDDICDGGGTFSGIAAVLRAHGATHVDLCVTHGVFSKGIAVAGIDLIYASDSYPAKCLQNILFETVNDRPIPERHFTENGQTRLIQLQNYVAQLF